MAIVANTFTSFSAKGIREELSDIISNISPEDVPLQSNIGSESVSNTYFEWQTDTLSAASSTAVIDGDDVASFDSTSATTRIGNYTQIARRTLIVADNLANQDLAGRNDEKSYQMAKRGKELKRDIEKVLCENNARVAGNSSTARETAGLGAWIATNTSKGATGTDPTATDGSDARNDGTQRDLTEAMVKDVMQQAFTAGGTPSLLMVGPYNKTVVSNFAGIAAQRYQAPSDGPTTIIGAADVYLSDFGTLSVVPNRFQRERDAFLLDPEYASVCYLRPIQAVDLAKTGDAEKGMVLAEFGLKVENEAAHGGVFDLNVS
ncbi:MAG: head protein [Phycisphaerae bacterium]|nr:head protein [Phycisphaerae bacterium]|tara:strand:- start:1900 stop:2856 length:957 start_codon:yes stop_codon:yes gene_type:complete